MQKQSPPNLVVALVAENENGILRKVSDDFLFRLSSLNLHQIVIDMRQADAAQQLLTLLKSGLVKFAYGFAGVGALFTINDGTSLWTAARTPYAALWYDHPCYNYRQHLADSPYVVHCYHAKDHLEARNRYLPARQSRSVLLSHYITPWPASSLPAWSARQMKIIYAKTGHNPSQWADDWNRHPANLQTTLQTLVEQAQSNRNIDLTAAALQAFTANGLDPGNLALLMDVVQEVDAYIRAWRSDRLARALLPYPAIIIGRGWDALESLPRKAEIRPALPAADYFDLARQMKIMANSNPLWREGLHERTEFGMCNGMVTLTDRNDMSDRLFDGLPSYVGFEWNDPLNEVIERALALAETDPMASWPSFEQELCGRQPATPISYEQQLLDAIETTRSYTDGLSSSISP